MPKKMQEMASLPLTCILQIKNNKERNNFIEISFNEKKIKGNEKG
jgi:hypothetical protein